MFFSVVKKNFLLPATTLFRVLDKTTMFFSVAPRCFFRGSKIFCSQPRRSLVCLLRPRCSFPWHHVYSFRGKISALSHDALSCAWLLDKTTMLFFSWHHVALWAVVKQIFLLSVTTPFLVLDKTTCCFPWHLVCSPWLNKTTIFFQTRLLSRGILSALSHNANSCDW